MKVRLDLAKDEKVKLKAVYARMTSEKLLEKCLLGYTQNPNESLHGRIWNLCPKVKNLEEKRWTSPFLRQVSTIILDMKQVIWVKNWGLRAQLL